MSADVRLMVDAVFLLFTIISFHKQRPGWKRPKSQGLQQTSSPRWREQQRVKIELGREKAREGKRQSLIKGERESERERE